MKDIIIQIGEDFNGVYLLNVLKTQLKEAIMPH